MGSVLGDERERSLLSPAWKLRIAFLAAVIVINLIALWLAWEDQNWVALGIAMVYGPIANGVLALVSLLAILFLKRKDPLFSPKLHALMSLLIPAVAALADLLAILSMGLSGC